MSDERTILPKAEPDKHLKKKSRSSSTHSSESSSVQVRTNGLHQESSSQL